MRSNLFIFFISVCAIGIILTAQHSEARKKGDSDGEQRDRAENTQFLRLGNAVASMIVFRTTSTARGQIQASRIVRIPSTRIPSTQSRIDRLQRPDTIFKFRRNKNGKCEKPSGLMGRIGPSYCGYKRCRNKIKVTCTRRCRKNRGNLYCSLACNRGMGCGPVPRPLVQAPPPVACKQSCSNICWDEFFSGCDKLCFKFAKSKGKDQSKDDRPEGSGRRGVCISSCTRRRFETRFQRACTSKCALQCIREVGSKERLRKNKDVPQSEEIEPGYTRLAQLELELGVAQLVAIEKSDKDIAEQLQVKEKALVKKTADHITQINEQLEEKLSEIRSQSRKKQEEVDMDMETKLENEHRNNRMDQDDTIRAHTIDSRDRVNMDMETEILAAKRDAQLAISDMKATAEEQLGRMRQQAQRDVSNEHEIKWRKYEEQVEIARTQARDSARRSQDYFRKTNDRINRGLEKEKKDFIGEIQRLTEKLKTAKGAAHDELMEQLQNKEHEEAEEQKGKRQRSLQAIASQTRLFVSMYQTSMGNEALSKKRQRLIHDAGLKLFMRTNMLKPYGNPDITQEEMDEFGILVIPRPDFSLRPPPKETGKESDFEGPPLPPQSIDEKTIAHKQAAEIDAQLDEEKDLDSLESEQKTMKAFSEQKKQSKELLKKLAGEIVSVEGDIKQRVKDNPLRKFAPDVKTWIDAKTNQEQVVLKSLNDIINSPLDIQVKVAHDNLPSDLQPKPPMNENPGGRAAAKLSAQVAPPKPAGPRIVKPIIEAGCSSVGTPCSRQMVQPIIQAGCTRSPC